MAGSSNFNKDVNDDQRSVSWCQMTDSEYAKVIFLDVLECYPADEDIECHYQLTESVKQQPNDYIGLFRVGWNNENECITSELCSNATVAHNTNVEYYRLIFKADDLPKNDCEFYQFCYLTEADEICGASTPFRCQTANDEDLIALDADADDDDFIVVRSKLFWKNTILEGHLRKNLEQISSLQKSKQDLEEKLHFANSNNAQLHSELKEATASMFQLQEKLNRYQKMLAEKEEELSHRVDEFNKLQLAVDEEKSTVQTLKASLHSATLQKESMKSQLNNTYQEKEALQNEIAGLQIELLNSTVKVDDMTHKLLEQQITVTSMKEGNASVEDKLQKLRKANIQLHQLRNNVEEEKVLLQNQLEDTKAMLQAQEDTKILLLSELNVHKEFKTEMSGVIEMIKSENHKLKQQLKVKEETLAQALEKIAQISALEENLSSEKEIWHKKEAELMNQISDLQLRLSEASDLYKEQYLNILQLKKQLRKLEKQRKVSASDSSIGELSELYRKKLSVSEVKRNLSSNLESLSGQSSDSDTGEHVSRTSYEKKSVASLSSSAGSSQQQISSVNKDPIGKLEICAETKVSSAVTKENCQKSSCTVDLSSLGHPMRNAMETSSSIDLLNIFDSIEKQEETETASAAYYEEPNHNVDFQASQPVVPGYTEINAEVSPTAPLWERVEEETIPSLFALPCPICEKEITVLSNNTSFMAEHLSNAHNQQLCPVCSQLFDMSLPPNYFKFHIENHFIKEMFP